MRTNTVIIPTVKVTTMSSIKLTKVNAVAMIKASTALIR